MPRVNDQIGPYQLIKKLGRGGFGEVWLAKNVTAFVAREVALKIPHDEDVDLNSIKQEAEIWLAASGHPNVLPFIEANVYEDYVAIVSEYAPDGSLRDWLKQHGGRAPSIEAALEMTRGILNGLAHLHARNIIHRDLKPDNILLQGTTPRITDFGISRVFKSTSHSAVSAGTPVYMAPEAYEARRNQQTDIWSVGIMLYQMLAGCLPFRGETYGEVMNAVLSKQPSPLPANVPGWLHRVVAKAIAKQPVERYKTALELLAALQKTARVQPIPAPTMTGNVPTNQSPETAVPNLQPAQKQSHVPPVNLAHQPLSAPVNRSKYLNSRQGGAAMIGIILLVFFIWQMRRTLNLESARQEPQPVVAANTAAKSEDSTLTKGQQYKAENHRVRKYIENIGGVRLEMMYVAGGSFIMGSDIDAGEKPLREVIVESFYMSKCEVTQMQWAAVMGKNPSSYKGSNLPVERVSWLDAKEFCNKLTQITGKPYKLPSEAEWEYACRAGRTGDYYASELDQLAWYSDNSKSRPNPVGQKKSNAFGLYDMHGNVLEWCEDVWHDNYNGAPRDGTAWINDGNSAWRVVRGGSWGGSYNSCRAAARNYAAPSIRLNNIGFRIASPVRDH